MAVMEIECFAHRRRRIEQPASTALVAWLEQVL